MPKAQKADKMEIRKPDWKKAMIHVVSEPPGLLMDRHASKDEEAKAPTAKNTPEDDALERALHKLQSPANGSKYGIPASAFQGSVVGGARWSDYDMTKIRGCVQVIPGSDGLIPIEANGGWQKFGRNCGLGGTKGSVWKVSPVFPEWKCGVLVEYMENFISLEDVTMLFSIAGKSVGVLGFSPRAKCCGPFGRFSVEGVSKA